MNFLIGVLIGTAVSAFELGHFISLVLIVGICLIVWRWVN